MSSSVRPSSTLVSLLFSSAAEEEADEQERDHFLHAADRDQHPSRKGFRTAAFPSQSDDGTITVVRNGHAFSGDGEEKEIFSSSWDEAKEHDALEQIYPEHPDDVGDIELMRPAASASEKAKRSSFQVDTPTDSPALELEDLEYLFNEYEDDPRLPSMATLDYAIGGDMTVFDAVRSKREQAVIQQAVADHPIACQTRDHDGNLPLHLAATYIASFDVFQALLAAYPEGAKTCNRFGQLPVHRACALNHAVKVVLLLIKAYPKGLECADDEGNLPIHYAAAYNHSIILHQCVALQRYVHTTGVKNHEGLLPLHLAALHNSTADNARLLIKCNPHTLHVRSEHDDLAVHLAVRYNVHEEVVRFMAMSSPDGLLSNHCIADLLDMRLAQQTLFSHERRHHHKGARQLHICGHTQAGKSVLAFWLNRKLSKFTKHAKRAGRGGSVFNCMQPQQKVMHLAPSQRTEGVNIKRIRYIDQSVHQRIDYTIYDYSGKMEYSINHARYLSVNDSVYVIVLPLFNLQKDVRHTFEELLVQYLHWLRVIFSVAFSYDQMNNNNEIERTTGRVVPSYDNRLQGMYTNATAYVKEVVNIPILTIINTFTEHTHLTPSSAEVIALADRLMASAKEVFANQRTLHVDSMLSTFEIAALSTSPTAASRSLQPVSSHLNSALYDKRMHFFDIVICNLEDKACLHAILPVLHNTSNVIFSKISTGLKNALLYIEKSLERNPLPIIMKHTNYVKNLRMRLQQFPGLISLDRLFSFEIIVDVLINCIIASFNRNGRILVINNKHFQCTATHRSGAMGTEDIVITDPFYLTNKVFNDILSKLSLLHEGSSMKQQPMQSYIFTRNVIDNVHGTAALATTFPRSSTNLVSSKSLVSDGGYDVDDDNSLLNELTSCQLLEIGGLLVPIQVDDHDQHLFCPGQYGIRSALPATRTGRFFQPAEDEIVLLGPATRMGRDHSQDKFILFGLITERPPADLLSNCLLRTHRTVLSSYFLLISKQYAFIPGFFMKLFYFLVHSENYSNDLIQFYSSALVMEIHRKQPDGRKLLFKKQVIISPVQYGQQEGFQVTIGITPADCVTNAAALPVEFVDNTNGLINNNYNVTQWEDTRQDAKQHRMIVERDCGKIKKFLNSQVWNIELVEVPLQCEREQMSGALQQDISSIAGCSPPCREEFVRIDI